MASINVLNQWIYLECVRARWDVYGIILVIWFHVFWYQERMELISHSCALCLSTERIQFWYNEEKDISHVQYAADFSTNWILFEYSPYEKGQYISTNTLVFLTSHTYQSYHRRDTMRLKSIPTDEDEDTSLVFFFRGHVPTNLLLAKGLFFFISKPFFTQIPQLMHAFSCL